MTHGPGVWGWMMQRWRMDDAAMTHGPGVWGWMTQRPRVWGWMSSPAG